jgi:hypothetical protein
MPELYPGERVLLVTRRHGITLIMPLLLVLISLSLLFIEACPVALALRLDGRCPLAVRVIGFVAGLVVLLDWLTTRFVLTDRRLFVVQAPLWRRTHGFFLKDVAGLTVRTGLLGRLFGFGDIVVDSSATQGGRLVLGFVPAPEALRDRIAAAISEATPAGRE